jgi:hypothetical protein
VTGLCKMNDCNLHQRGNTDKTWVYFYMPSNYTVGDTGAKHVVIKPSGNDVFYMSVCMSEQTATYDIYSMGQVIF